MGLLGFLLVMMISVTESASRAWRDGRSRTENFQSARTALEIMTRELAPAVVDTNTQFVIAPSEVISTKVPPSNDPYKKTEGDMIAKNAPVLLWLAPLGDAGELRTVGYYLSRDFDRDFYRLKRIYIAPPKRDDRLDSPYFPRLTLATSATDLSLRTSPVNAVWFNRDWNGDAFDEESETKNQFGKDKVVVSTAADGVIALWVQPIDLLGNPIPRLSRDSLHPAPEGGVGYPLEFNSAAYFQMATTQPFEDGKTFQYLPHTKESPLDPSYHTMKANRLPAAVEITLVTLDSRTLRRHPRVPDQPEHLASDLVLDVAGELQKFQTSLNEVGLRNTRTFTTRVKLVNGS